MYKKIYKTMCTVTLASLIVLSLFIVTVSYVLLSNHAAENTMQEALLLADAINEKNGLTVLEEGSFSFLDADIYSPNGISRLDGKENTHVKNLTENGFISGRKAYAVLLDDGNILTLSSNTRSLYYILGVVISTAVIVLILVYILTLGVASSLTRKILEPLKDIYSYEQDCIYEELAPFVNRLTAQTNEIKRQEKKVKEQKNRLQAISENMNEGLIVVDTKKEILLVNKSILALFSATEDKVKHRDFSLLSSNKKLADCLERALSGSKSYTEHKTYQVFFSPVFEKEQVKGVVILFIDASEKLKTEQIRREFSANVSHELKTPLTTIHGYSQIITNGIAKSDDITAFAAKIEHESLRMINLIDDIIKLSRLDEQSDAPQKEETDITAAASDVIAVLAQKAERRNVTVELIPGAARIFANKSQITEMIYNLVDNAIKYNKDGGSVTVAVGEKGFSVSDTGIGIPAKYIDRIYERFFRADKSHSKKIGGTGLGLSIVKHIVVSNGGKIEVESIEGQGTCFTVTF